MAQNKAIQTVDPDQIGSGQAVDGRSARRDRNRLAVIDAAIQLFAEGNLRPDPAEIAHRCGLSPKSVNRYFEDLDDLIGAAAARQMERVFPLYRIHAIGRGPLGHRIDDFVRVRLDAQEVMGGVNRAANFLAIRQPSVRKALDDARALARNQIEAQFVPELKPLSADQRESTVAAIDVLFQSDALDYFRVHRGFSSSVTHTTLVDALYKLLRPLRSPSQTKLSPRQNRR